VGAVRQRHGPGIAPRHHAHIWELFRKLPHDASDGARGSEGAGIGLVVVRKIVESHGGRAWVESAEGQGATFRFTWPAIRPGEPVRRRAFARSLVTRALVGLFRATVRGTCLALHPPMRDQEQDVAKNASDHGTDELEIEVELEDDDCEHPDEDDIEEIDLDDLAAMEGPDA
jgi:hypothetical protein